MIVSKPLIEVHQFEAIKKGDFLAVEWHLDSRIGDRRTRFAVYEVVDNLKADHGLTEIILQTRNNVYFNYLGFIAGHSNAKSVSLITQEP